MADDVLHDLFILGLINDFEFADQLFELSHV
jgi:hypothetical protein